jgi:hypothetical protein
MAATTLEFIGLSALDQEELQQIGSSDVTFIEPQVPEGMLAEPATIAAIVTLGSLSLVTLAAYLAQGRRRHLLKRSVRITHPDGRVEERTLVISSSTQDGVKAEILGQLAAWIGKGTS